jgi:hypothetical protein
MSMMRIRTRSMMLAAVLLVSGAASQAEGPLLYHTLTPCRLVETRNPNGPSGGPILSSGLQGSARTFPVRGLCGVPAGAKAVSVNVVAIGPSAAGYLSLYPGGSALPGVSTVNYLGGEWAGIANGTIVSLGAAGNPDLAVFAYVLNSGTVHMALDVSGYFD